MRRLRFSQLQLIALALLALALPFELKHPIVSLGPIVITTVEAILYSVSVVWISGLVRARRMHWTVVHSAVVLWLIVQLASALFAPSEREAAVKFALRSTGGATLFFIAVEWSRAPRRAAVVMSAVTIGAVVSALAGWLETESSMMQTALLIFKTQATLVGGQLRAGGTFQYANTAAMYWEAALPLLIAAGAWWSLERARRRWLVGALVAGLIVIEAIVLSSSRAAMIGTALALVILIAADRASSNRSGVGRPAAFVLIALLGLIGVQLFVNPVLAARLRSENDDSWFQAAIQPQHASLNVSAGEVISQTVIITNTSVRTWPITADRPVYLSYHWIQPTTGRVLILDGARTHLPRNLSPGESVSVSARVEVPNLPGRLTLQWDLVQEQVTWFGERGSPAAEVAVNISAGPPSPENAPRPIPSQLGRSISPPRSDLWRAGVKMWLAYPLLGVGPDNFRHVYGKYLGQADFDDRITANSWYVEVLATTGLMGFIAWMLIAIAVLIVLRQHWRRLATRSTRALALGLSVALLTFFVHGLVDYFMEFTPTYGLFWSIAGLLIGLLTGARDDESARTTDRI